jgi:hypothetical protein
VGKHLIRPTQEFTTELPFSEVCMHLRVAGTRMRARLLPNGMVQLLGPDGTDFSFPITAGEAGLDPDEQGAWLVTVDDQPNWPADDCSVDERDAAAQRPWCHPEVGGQHRARMLLDAISEPLATPDPHPWRGDVIDGPGGRLHWHPDLGYLSVPDRDDQS